MALRRRERGSLGLRPTRVCRWFVGFAAITALAATNTGNNGLFLVVALMVAALVVTQLVAAANVRNIDVEVRPPAEVYANTPSLWKLECRNRGRFLDRRWLSITMAVDGLSGKIDEVGHLPLLGTSKESKLRVSAMFATRGVKVTRGVRVTSLFPFGLFAKGRVYPFDREVVVYPELFGLGGRPPKHMGRAGDERGRKVGWGHELLALRAFRSGDDPRGIHWKQSARTGSMVYQERREEENRRIVIVFDNAVGRESGGPLFERLISEAATATVELLERGFEVALQTRDEVVRFGGGPHQRHLVLRTLACLTPCERSSSPLRPIHEPAMVLSPLEDRAA